MGPKGACSAIAIVEVAYAITSYGQIMAGLLQLLVETEIHCLQWVSKMYGSLVGNATTTARGRILDVCASLTQDVVANCILWDNH